MKLFSCDKEKDRIFISKADAILLKAPGTFSHYAQFWSCLRRCGMVMKT